MHDQTKRLNILTVKEIQVSIGNALSALPAYFQRKHQILRFTRWLLYDTKIQAVKPGGRACLLALFHFLPLSKGQ
jgi:hypothetical protein